MNTFITNNRLGKYNWYLYFSLIYGIAFLGQMGVYIILVIGGLQIIFGKTPTKLIGFFTLFIFQIINTKITGGISSTAAFVKLCLMAIFCVMIYLKYKKKISYLPILRFIYFYGFYCLIAGLLASELLGLTIIKISFFILVTTSLLLAFTFSKYRIDNWIKLIINFYVVTLCFSFLLYPFTNISFYGNYQDVSHPGFQGITDQAQTLAITIVPIVAYLLMKIIYSPKIKINSILFFIFSFVCLVLSGGRVGYMAIILSFIALFIWRLFKSKNNNPTKFKVRLTKKNSILLSIIFIILVLQFSKVQDFVNNRIINKYGQQNVHGLVSSFESSRGKKVDLSLANFYSHPILGIGFGIPSILNYSEITFDPLFGIPISAIYEKGIIFTASLEETGILGFILFIILFIKIMIDIYKHNNILVIILCYCALFTNFGESTLFSLNGSGMFVWFIIGIGYSSYFTAQSNEGKMYNKRNSKVLFPLSS